MTVRLNTKKNIQNKKIKKDFRTYKSHIGHILVKHQYNELHPGKIN